MKKTVSLLSMLMLSCPLWAATAPLLLPSMVTIKGGEFSMGSTAHPRDDNYPASEPVHTVSVKSYRLSRYETTVGQFRQFVEATGYQAEGDCWTAKRNGNMRHAPAATPAIRTATTRLACASMPMFSTAAASRPSPS